MTDGSIARREGRVVLALCAVLSLIALWWSWTNHALLNYGDAVAHLHIARRVFDSRLPRVSELGSVWLPLPHLLMLPFAQVYAWWANGLAAVLPSALAYIFSAVGFYRLARRWLSLPAAAIALVFFAANPNLLYLQTTAMTEPLFLCEMIWIAVWLVEWRAALDADEGCASRLQVLIAMGLVAAVFTRYDGWIIALLAWSAMGIALLRRERLKSLSFWLLSALVVAAPLTWFIYNAVAFHDWLYFQRGPYSALAIEMRTAKAAPGYPLHPGWHNPWVSLLFYLKAAELDAVTAQWIWGNVMLVISALGLIWACITVRRRGFLWALLLWIPIPFYAYSVAYGSVPIFLPPWWPHSHYNLRYGLEILPALALGLGFAAQFALQKLNSGAPSIPRSLRNGWETVALSPRRITQAAIALFLVLLAINAIELLRERPLVYVEGTKNKQAHLPYETQIPPVLRSLLAQRPGAAVLMDTSYNPEIVALTGIPLRQTINESDLTIYTDALAAPAAHAAMVLALDGDEIDHAVHAHPEGLTVYQRFHAPGQPNATIYLSNTPDSSRLNNPAAR